MAKKKANSTEKKSQDRSGLFVPAGIFIGMGIGFITGQVVGFLFLGLGVGFVLMALARYVDKE